MGTRGFSPNSGDPWLLSLPHMTPHREWVEPCHRGVFVGIWAHHHTIVFRSALKVWPTHTWRVLLSMGVFRNVEFSLEQEHTVDFQMTFGRCLTSSLISYFLNTSCAKALIHYCTAKHVRVPAAVHDAWLDQLACTEKLIEQKHMRRLVHALQPNSHYIESLKNALR